MSLFDPTTGIVDAIVKAIEVLREQQAAAIVEGFEKAAEILADRLEKIEETKRKL